MLDLSTLSKFKSDIEGNHVTAYPLIIIGADTDNPLYISTIKETIVDIEYDDDGNEVNRTPLVFKDYNLKISNIKESINLESHVIKISNVSITLNNYEQNGERLSDSLTTSINITVNVLYKTQSCNSMQDCLPLYKGVVRRIEHDDKDLKITLEDLTDATFHKDVPTANLGTSRHCFNKDYINRYIPMVYGKVSKSPSIPYIDNVGDQGNYYISIISDDVEDVTGSGRGLSISGFLEDSESPDNVMFPTNPIYDEDSNPISGNDIHNPLFIYKSDYFRVPRNYEIDFHNIGGQTLYSKPQQYKIDSSGNFLKIERFYSSGFAQNPPAANEFQAFKLYYPSQAEILKTEISSGDDGTDGSKVINIPTSIKNPEASIDNLEMVSTFIDGADFDEFSTYSEIPYNEIDIEAAEGDLTWQVSGFRPSYFGTSRHGIHFPSKNNPGTYDSFTEAGWVGATNYLYWVSGWLQINAHHLNKSVKFVSMPTGNMIRARVDTVIRKPEYGLAKNEDWQASSSRFIDMDYDVRVVPQYQLDSTYRKNWCAASMIPNNHTRVIKDVTTSSSNEEGRIYQTNEVGTVKWLHGSGSNWTNVLDSEDSYAGENEIFIARERIHHYFPRTADYEELDYWFKDKCNDLGSGYSSTSGTNGYLSEYNNLLPVEYYFMYDSPYSNPANRGVYMTNRDLLRGYEADLAEGGKAPCYYPSTVFKFRLEEDHQNNMFQLTHVYVGQWVNETMGEYTSLSLEEVSNLESQVAPGVDLSGTYKSIWINLFHDPDNDHIPSLFSSMDDFAVFTPTSLIEKRFGDDVSGGNDEHSIMVKYYADWNGNEINTYQGSTITQGNDSISSKYYAGGYGYNNYNELNPKIREKDLCQLSSSGQSWFMYIDDEISGDKPMTKMYESGSFEDIGEYELPSPTGGAGTIIPKGCLIPCNHMQNEDHGGMDWEVAVRNVDKGIPTILGDSPNDVRISAGASGVAENRLGILFPFSNISADDTADGETKTFVYGKLDVDFAAETDEAEIHFMGDGDKFLVQAYGAETTASDDLNYNAEWVGGSDLACNLIDIDGNDSIFTPNVGINTRSWHFKDENTEFDNINAHFIEAWDSPNAFDALSLAYRVLGNASEQDQPISQISTRIYSIGIIQFNQFQNVFTSDLYVDVKGRANNSEDAVLQDTSLIYKYTDRSVHSSAVSDNINKPTDIIYHMIEKELGQIDVVNRDSMKEARDSLLIEEIGFTITDKINSRKLIEDICKSTNLYPRFGNNGEFDFKFIKNTYSESSVDIHIKQKDITKFSFTRTPIENVRTMVNVKYKKDYAKDTYAKATGYCDAHDFFGNGDNGADVLRYNGGLGNSFDGYDYVSLGLERKSNILEFESSYIRNADEAIKLRNFLLMQNCNQHTIIKCTLPLKYIHTEVGDIVKFDKLNNNTKAYGEDYSSSNENVIIRNGQEIYPYFIITSATKSSKNIKIECMQLHRLERTFTAGAGSLTRRSERGIFGIQEQVDGLTEDILGNEVYFNFINGDFTAGDLKIYQDILSGHISYLTSEQKNNADMDNNGIVNQEDVNYLLSFFSLVLTEGQEDEEGIVNPDIIVGDITGDGIVNVVDIVTLVSFVLGTEIPTTDQFNAANITGDEEVNVVDIVTLVSLVLGDN
tara:strand:+ start:4027 stop:8943 length:4917 start_codon:yes stop_codon:yes gene_type:complete